MIPAPRNPLTIVLDNIRSAFNVGSIFRSADACVVEKILLCGMTACPPHPRLIRTALGAETVVPWEYHRHTMNALDELEARRIPLVAIEVTDQAIPHVDYDWPSPVALVVGHETRGIAPDLLKRCTAVVRIPMYGEKNTLNVATAAGIILYEVLRHWGALDAPARGAQHRFEAP